MTNVVRFDRGLPGTFQIDENGFAVADATLTRTGVFYYRNEDGSVRAELRVEEEVFSPSALESMKMLPVTNEHPPEMLDSENAKQFTVGFGSENIERFENMVKTTIKVTDRDTIRDIQDGRKQEISMGYLAELDMTPGVWNGIKYDAVQTNIRYNHIAIVPRGRAGSQCRIKTDSEDVRSSVEKPPSNVGGNDMKKVRFDGFEVELEDTVAVALEKHLDANGNKMKEMEDKIASLKDELMKAQKEYDAMKGKNDAHEGKLEDLQKKLDEAVKAANDHERIQKLVKDRAELIERAKPLVDKEVKLDELSDSEVKVAAIKAQLPKLDLEGASQDRIDGLFEGIAATAPRKDSMDSALQGLSNKTDDFDELVAKSREAERNRWKTTLGKTKE